VDLILGRRAEGHHDRCHTVRRYERSNAVVGQSTTVIDPAERLRYFLQQDAFAICPMLSARDFVSFCKDRGITTSEEQLERFEKLGILYPIARMKRPWLTHKIEYTDEGRSYMDHGLVNEGESWSGDTLAEWGRWRRGDAADEIELLDEGHLWDPRQKPFQSWSTFHDENGTHTESFYSMFQAYPLEWKLMWLECRVDRSIFVDGVDPTRVGQRMADDIAARVELLHDPMPEDDVAFLAQSLSTRYYPLTQTDRRTFMDTDRRFLWERNGYVRLCVSEIGIDEKELCDHQRQVAMIAQSRDPLHRWYQLVRFIAIDKKKQLTGHAQYAQLLYAIEYMCRMFAKDAFARELDRPDEDHTWKNEDLYGEGIPDDPLRHLEFVVNSYHLNPRPKLILVVEGRCEETIIPRIASEAMGYELSTIGIEIRALGGVGEYTGKKKYEKLGALAKFIDDYHFRQTPVVLLLDREGRVEMVTNNLRNATSKLYPQRMLTKPEYLRIWKRSIEFDNFTQAEIAATLTKLADGNGRFSPEEVAAARDSYDRKEADPLSALFLLKTGRDLEKVAYLQTLADLLIQAVRDVGLEAQMKVRPLLAILDEVIDVARLNHQPVTLDIWKMNQESGYFGAVIAPKT
jgi:hypothetical protein